MAMAVELAGTAKKLLECNKKWCNSKMLTLIYSVIEVSEEVTMAVELAGTAKKLLECQVCYQICRRVVQQ